MKPVQIIGATFCLIGLPPIVRAASSNDPFVQLGRVAVRPHLTYGSTYSDGLQARPGEPTAATVDHFTPGILLNLGTSWTFDYSPTWTYYSNPAFHNTLDHNLVASGATAGTGWDFTFAQNLSSSSGPQIETGRQTSIVTSTTTIGGQYRFGPRISLTTGAAQSLTFTQASSDIYNWTIHEAMRYMVSPKVDASIGTEAGYVAIYKSPDSAYVRPNVQLDWRPGRKLTLGITGGIEERMYLGGRRTWLETPTYAFTLGYQPTKTIDLTLSIQRGGEDVKIRGAENSGHPDPTYSLSAGYRPFDNTSVTMTASRALTPSPFFGGHTVESRGWSIGLGQRLLKHIQLTGGVEGNESLYISSGNPLLAAAGRNDRKSSQHVSIGTTFLRRGTISIIYQHTHNASNNAGFGVTSKSLGGEIGFRY